MSRTASERIADPSAPVVLVVDDDAAIRTVVRWQLDDAGFRARFSGSPVKRVGRDRFIRNVLTAIGNSGDPTLLPAAERLRADANPVVAEAAEWAAARLQGGGAP